MFWRDHIMLPIYTVSQTEREARLIENLAATNFADKIADQDMTKIGSLNLNLRKFHEPYKMP